MNTTPANALYSSDRQYTQHLTLADVDSYQQFIVTNKDRFAPFEPLRAESYYFLEEAKKRVQQVEKGFDNRTSVSIAMFDRKHLQMIGLMNFTNIVTGCFQACYLGFSIDGEFEGRGYMKEALKHTLPYIQSEFGIHRVMANHLPHNQRSARLLNKLGFEEEGFAKSYLKINGTWQDHVLTSYVFEEL